MKEGDEVKMHFKFPSFTRMEKCFLLHSLKVHHHLIKILRKGVRVAKLGLKGGNVKENKSGLTVSSGYPAFQKGAPPASRSCAQGQH